MGTAIGLFETGPDSKLDVASLYDLKKQVADVKGLPTNASFNLTNAQGDITSVSVGYDNIINNVLDTLGLDREALYNPAITNDRINNPANGGIGGSVNISTMCKLTTAGLINAIKHGDGTIQDTVKDLLGNVMEIRRGSTPAEIQRLMAFAKSYLGDAITLPTILDDAVHSGVAKQLLSEAIKMGVASLIPLLLADVDNRKDVSRAEVLELTEDSIKQGDIATVVELVRVLGSSTVVSKYPDIVDDLIAVYRFPLNTETADYAALSVKLIASLNEINPYWLYYQRGPKIIVSNIGTIVDDIYLPAGSDISNPPITRLKALARASDDAYTLLLMDPEIQPALMIARDFPSKPIGTVVKQNFPFIAI